MIFWKSRLREEKMVDSRKKLFFVSLLLYGLLFIGFVLAGPPQWISGSDTVNYTTIEDSIYYYNFSANITGFNNDVTFAINTVDNNISWTNVSGPYIFSNENIISSWIKVTNSSTGNLTINATYDNQTGFFSIPIQATNTSGGSTTVAFEFIINATNDFPNITNINLTYNSSMLSSLYSFLNATDEENQFPLIFNVTFNSTNCTHASWSGMNNNENCSLYDFGFNLTHPNNVSALMNFVSLNNHTGIYYANISVRDAGANYACPHSYCNNDTYKQNKTTYYSSIVTFNVLSSLEVNVSDCQNKIFQENQSGTCNVTVRTKGESDSLNVSSYAILRNYASGQSSVLNTSWFYSSVSTTSSNFAKTIVVNITPQKTEIGNWTINFTVNDITHNENSTTGIYVYVNKTSSDAPDLSSISALNASVNQNIVINLSTYDDDLLIPDKNSAWGGFNESINFSRTILNRSDLSQQLSLSNFSITVLQMPVSGTNRTTAEIRFTANTSDIGDYTINVSVNDSEGFLDYELFNLSIINNSAPEWFSNVSTNFTLVEGTGFYMNFSQNVSDPDGDPLTFSYVNDTAFSSFSVNSTTGIVNFTPIDEDVGQHLVNITISDGYLTDTEYFNFTVQNINDNFSFLNLTTINATPLSGITNGSIINVSEDNYTKINLWIEDDDFKIPSNQKSFYNESFTVNLTLQGANTTLFTFVRDYSWPFSLYPNRSLHQAIFTPGKADVGSYNVTINVTDRSNYSSSLFLYMNVLPINHDPVLSNFSNQSSAVNRTLYYDINVTDREDGNDTSTVNSNFTFNYTFLNGTDFINSNQTIFNTTTGILNVTFNSTQEGSYRINISVNDSSGSEDYEDFWIYVYGSPNISFPSAGYVFNLTENSTSVLNFTVNNSISDNLTYAFYVDSISYNGSFNYGNLVLRYNTSSYANGSNFSWNFMPNFTDETYGQLKNLTLVVYPSSSSLENANQVNTSVNFKLNISHTNSPVNFTGTIEDKGPVSYGSPITVDLTDYFSDIDYSDPYYGQSITWSINRNTTSITYSEGWATTFSATSAVTGLINITASDGSTTATSNNFRVTFIEPVVGESTTTTNSGSSTRDVPVSLKIIMPDPISAYQEDKIVLPITLFNNGQQALTGINLSAAVIKNGTVTKDIAMSFDTSYLNSLGVGEKKNVTLTINVSTKEVGLFEITVYAKVKSPVYEDWGKLFLTIKEGVDIEEKILFTEELIISNPECIELKELINDAKKYAQAGDSTKAVEKAEEAIDACKLAISQANKAREKKVVENKLYRYLLIGTLGAFLLGIGYYSYKRIKLRRRNSFIQQDIKNRNYFNNK